MRSPAQRSGSSRSSPGQDNILRLIADGLSNAEIGKQLYISETTVKTHVTHILAKLGLRDRVQAVVLAYQTGLFENAPPRNSAATRMRSRVNIGIGAAHAWRRVAQN